MAFVNSSGYAGLTDTPLARVGYAKTFVNRFFCNGMIPDITYSDYDTELVQCNQIVQFTKQPIVRWKPYQKTRIRFRRKSIWTTSASSCASRLRVDQD